MRFLNLKSLNLQTQFCLKSIKMKRFYIVFIYILLSVTRSVGQPYCTLRTFTFRDGLASNTISSMIATNNSLMWFSTWNGVCCYDGYNFRTFRDYKSASEVLSSNRFLNIKASKRDNLWSITYDRRLYLFDTHQCRYIDVSRMIEKKYGSCPEIRAVYPLENGTTWIVSPQGDVNFIAKDDFKGNECEIEKVILGKGSQQHPIIRKVVEDSKQRVWVFTNRGVRLWNGKFQSGTVFDHFAEVGNNMIFASPEGHVALWREGWKVSKPLSFTMQLGKINKMMSVSDRYVLFATDKQMTIYDTKEKTLNTGLLGNVTNCFTDSKRRIWAVTDDKGLYFCQAIKDKFLALSSQQTAFGLTSSLTAKVPFFQEDNNGTVWVATTTIPLCYYDEAAQRLVPANLPTSAFTGMGQTEMAKFFTDKQHNLWFTGTCGLGLINFKKSNFLFTEISKMQEARAVLSTPDGSIWVGMFQGELVKIDQNGKVLGYLNKQGKLQAAKTRLSEKIYSLFLDSQERLWIGTKGKGLYVLDKGKLQHFLYNGTSSAPSDNQIYGFDEDRQHRIWIATYGGGVNIAYKNRANDKFVFASSNSQKTWNVGKFKDIRRITHTKSGIMLLSSNTGLLTANGNVGDLSQLRFFASQHNAAEKSSILTNDVMQTLVTKSGRIFVVTLGGGVQEIKQEKLLADNLKLERLNNVTLDYGLVQSLVEDNSGNMWIVRESAVEKYNLRSKTIELFNIVDAFGTAKLSEALPTYSLKSGKITLGVIGGALSFDPRVLKKSLFSPKIIFTGVNYQGTDQVEPILEKDVLDVESDKRNLTIYFAALDYNNQGQVRYAYKLDKIDKEWNYVGTSNSASFNNLPHGNLRLLVKSTNSSGVWVDNIAVLNIHSQPVFWETIWAWLLYLLILLGLLFIAAYIYRLRVNNRMERRMNKLKTDFFTDISHRLRTPLTLIGGPINEVLSTNTLETKAKGMLEMVRRNAEEMLKLVNSMLHYEGRGNVYISDENVQSLNEEQMEELVTEQKAADKEALRLLIVEDNSDLRAFLCSILQGEYQVIEAINGMDGLNKAREEMPDFILTDVTMPQMDGITMVKNIKQDNNICHIPIVVLSAKASLEDRITGLKQGIDDYITMPFSATYLKQRMQNIIASRRLLQQQHLQGIKESKGEAKEDLMEMKEPLFPDADKEMMRRLMSYLEKNIDNADLKIEDLADAVCLGRTVFYGKVKAIVGMTPIDFLRQVRMQKAEQLITKTKMNVSQVAYAVGFSDPKYFSKCFKTETGMTPSQYRAQATKDAF